MAIQLKQYQLDYQKSDAFKQQQIINSHYDFLQTQSRIREIETHSKLSKINLIESYVYILISISAIEGIDETSSINSQKKLSANYCNSLKFHTLNFPLYNVEFLKDLIYTVRSTWATSTGTLGYYLNLEYSDFKYHYLSPAELGHYCVLSFLNQSRQTLNLNLSSIYTQYLDLATEDSDKRASLFYNLTTEVWQGFDLNKTFQLLKFFHSFLPKLTNWYFNNYQRELTNEADIILKKLALICLSHNLDFQELKTIDLQREFIFQKLPSIYFIVFRKIIYQRKLIFDNLNIEVLNENIESERLLKNYLENITISLEPNLIELKSEILLTQLAPPAGYNLLLICVATFLMANAYNLAIKNIENPQLNKLSFQAGYTLGKSNLKHLQKLGKNLMVFSNLKPDIDLKDLKNIHI